MWQAVFWIICKMKHYIFVTFRVSRYTLQHLKIQKQLKVMSHINDHIAHASVHLEFVYGIFAGRRIGHNSSEWAVSFFGVPLVMRRFHLSQ